MSSTPTLGRTSEPADGAQPQPGLHASLGLLTALGLMVAAWCLYMPSVWYDFVSFDDVRILKEHPELYGQPKLSQALHAIFVGAFPREEPLLLRDVSWAIDSRIFGFGNPLGYHLGNVLLHGLVVGILFGFLLKMTGRYGLALITTGAWLLLAVHAEPVAWIMGRKDILCALFVLLALWTQTKRLEAETKRTCWLWYGITIVMVLCALLSKISAVMLPLVLLLEVYFLPYLRKDPSANAIKPSFRRFASESLLSLPNFIASGVIYVWYSRTLTQVGLFDRGYTAHGFSHMWNLVMINPMALWVYLKQLLWPSSLTVLYTWPALQQSYSQSQVIGSLLTVVLVLAAGAWLFRKRKDLFFYSSSFILLMVPYLNLTYIGIWVADRYIYLAALFPLLILVSVVFEIIRDRPMVVRGVAMAVAGVLALNNLSQKLIYQAAWKNGETLWQYNVSLPNPSPEAFANLAAYYYSVASSRRGTSESEPALRKMSVAIEAGLDQFWRNREQPAPTEVWKLVFLSSILQEVCGRPQQALDSLLLADQLMPKFDSINLNLARLYLRLSKSCPEAQQQEAYANQARGRFQTYIRLAFRGRTPPLEVRQEMATIEEACKVSAPQSTQSSG